MLAILETSTVSMICLSQPHKSLKPKVAKTQYPTILLDPLQQGVQFKTGEAVWDHLGVYNYRRALQKLLSLPQTLLGPPA